MLGSPKVPSPPLLFQVTPEMSVALAITFTIPPLQMLLTSLVAVTVGGSLNVRGIIIGSDIHPSMVTSTHKSFRSVREAN